MMAVSVVSLALVMALPASSTGAEEWKTVRSGPGDFSVSVPGPARQQAQTRKGPNGTMTLHTIVARAGDVTYLASRIPNAGPVPKAQQEAFFDGVRKSFVRFAKGGERTLLSEKRTTFAEAPADDLVVEGPGPDGRPLVMLARFLLWDENTSFGLQVVAPRGRAGESEAERFFASFRVGKASADAPEAPAAEGGAPTWGTFTSAAGGFSVRMPGKPVARNQTQKTPLGDLAVSAYVVEGPRGAYTAYVFPERVAALDAARQQKSLEEMCQGAVMGMMGTMRQVTPIALGGAPGREFRFDFPIPGTLATGNGRGRAYLVGRKAYLILMCGAAGESDRPEVDAFLKSFRLTTAAGGPEAAPGPRRPARPRPAQVR